MTRERAFFLPSRIKRDGHSPFRGARPIALSFRFCGRRLLEQFLEQFLEQAAQAEEGICFLLFCAPTEPVYTLQEAQRPSAEVAVITA